LEQPLCVVGFAACLRLAARGRRGGELQAQEQKESC
jgi:hypothetical protein